jgi:hypothetical protein
VVSLSVSMTTPGQFVKWTKTFSFYAPANSLFINLPTLRRYVLWVTDSTTV